MRQNDITVIVGRKHAGKSSQARALAATRAKRIIVDPMYEHEGLGVLAHSLDALLAYLRPIRHGSYGIVFRSMDDTERDQLIELATAGTPYNPPLPGLTMMLDEIDKVCSPQFITPGLKRLANYGRHFQVSMIAITRRPRGIHHDITANADRIIVGQTQEPADLDYLKSFIGADLAARAKRLRGHQFVTWPDDLEELEEDAPLPPPPHPANAPPHFGSAPAPPVSATQLDLDAPAA